MLGADFITTAEWESYPFTELNPFSGIVIDASVTLSTNAVIRLTALAASTLDIQFSAVVEDGTIVTFDTATAVSKKITVYGSYTMVRARFAQLVAVFLLDTASVVNVSGNGVLTSKATIVTSDTLSSINGLYNVVTLLENSGLIVEINANDEIQISRNEENPCPENCPPSPVLTINGAFGGARNVSILGDCNSAKNDELTSTITLKNSCAPCFDCGDQVILHNAVVATYNYYNKMVEELELISEQYTRLKATLIEQANAVGDTLSVQEINLYMPDDLFTLKQ
jgi:hypothetical protein